MPQRIGTAYVDIHGDFKSLNRELRSNQTAFTRSLRGMESSATSAFRAIGASQQGVIREQRGFATRIAATGAEVAAMGRRVEHTGSSLFTTGRELNRSVGIPLGIAGIAAGKFAIDFEKAMEMVHTQAGASQREVDNLRGKVLQLAREGQSGPTELANALFHLESVGLRGSRAMEALRVAEEGATVGGADLESVTNALAGATQSGIKGTQNLRGAMGTLNAIIGQGNLRLDDLVGALSTGILPVARSFGLSLTDVGAALATLTSKGVPAAAAATRLRLTFSLLGSPTDKATATLNRLGLTSEQLARTMRERGLIPALRELKAHLDDFTRDPVKQSQAISAMFGGGRSSSAITTLLQNIDDLDRRQQGIVRNSGRFGEAVAKTHETAAFKVHHAWASIQADMVEIGATLVPIAVEGLDLLSKAANAFERLPKPVKEVAIGLGAITVAAGPVLAAIGALTRLSGFALIGIGKFTEGLGRVGAASARGFSGEFVSTMRAAGAEGGVAAASGVASTNGAMAAQGAAAGRAYGGAFTAASTGGRRTTGRRIAQEGPNVRRAAAGEIGALGGGAVVAQQGFREAGPISQLGPRVTTAQRLAQSAVVRTGLDMTKGLAVIAGAFAAVDASIKVLQNRAERKSPDILKQLRARGTNPLAGSLLSEIPGVGAPLQGLLRSSLFSETPARKLSGTLEDILKKHRGITAQQEAEIRNQTFELHLTEQQRIAVDRILHQGRRQDPFRSLNDQLTGRRVEAGAGRGVLGIGKALADEGRVTDTVVDRIVRKLGRIPPGVRAAAAGTIIEVARGLQDQGKLDGPLSKLNAKVLRAVDGLGRVPTRGLERLASRIGVTAEQLVGAVADPTSEMGTIVADALQLFGEGGSARRVRAGLHRQAVARRHSGPAAKQIQRGAARGGSLPGYSHIDDVLINARSGEAILTPEKHQPEVNTAMAFARAHGITRHGSLGEMFRKTGAHIRGFAQGGHVEKPPAFRAGGWVTGDTDFLPRLYKALEEMAKAAKQTIYVQSGRRTIGEQQALYNKYAGTGHPVAVPSPNAPHVRGVAADITPGRSVFGRLAERFGLGFTVAGEPWHVQLLGDAGGRAQATPDAHRVGPVRVDGPSPRRELVAGALGLVRRAANRTIDRASARVSAAGAVSEPSTLPEGPWRVTLNRIARERGWSASDWEWIVSHESGGRVSAKNPKSTAFGLGQLLDSTYAQYGGGPGSNGPEQIAAMARYIAERYGNPTKAKAFWEGHHWYSRGGMVDFAAGGAVPGAVEAQHKLSKDKQSKIKALKKQLLQHRRRLAPRFRAEVSKAWQASRSLYPNARAMPRVLLRSDVPEDAEAVTITGGKHSGDVHWPWAGIEEFVEHRGRTLNTLLHEWTHSHQRRDVTSHERLSEGGAVLFAHDFDQVVARRLGWKHLDRSPLETPQYEGFAQDVRRRGLDWVTHDQFIKPKGKYPKPATKRILPELVAEAARKRKYPAITPPKKPTKPKDEDLYKAQHMGYTKEQWDDYIKSHHGETPKTVAGDQKQAQQRKQQRDKERHKSQHDRRVKALRKSRRHRLHRVLARVRRRLQVSDIAGPFDETITSLNRQITHADGVLSNLTRADQRDPLDDVLVPRDDKGLPKYAGHQFLDLGKDDLGDLTLGAQHIGRLDPEIHQLVLERAIQTDVGGLADVYRTAMGRLRATITNRHHEGNVLHRAIATLDEITAERRQKKPNRTRLTRLESHLRTDAADLGLPRASFVGDQGFQVKVRARLRDQLSGIEGDESQPTSIKSLRSDLTRFTADNDDLMGAGGAADSTLNDLLDMQAERATFTAEGIRKQLEGERASTSQAANITIAGTQQDALLSAVRELVRTYGSNFQPIVRPRFTYAEGGTIPGPKGSPQTIQGHGGEVILNPDQLEVLVKNAKGEGVVFNQTNNFPTPPPDPHHWARRQSSEIRAAF